MARPNSNKRPRVGQHRTHTRNENRLFRQWIESGVPREVAERRRAALAAKHARQRAAAGIPDRQFS